MLWFYTSLYLPAEKVGPITVRRGGGAIHTGAYHCVPGPLPLRHSGTSLAAPLPPPQGVPSGRQRHHITTTRRPIKVDLQYHSIPNLSKGSKINLPGHPLPLSYLGPDPSSNVAFVFGLPTGCLSVWCLQASIQPLL